MQLEKMIHRLLGEIKLEEDSLRIYHLPPDKERRVKVYGVRPPVDLDEPLIL
jgi:CRISPR/Cas system-associated endoribonuclease Cas2